MQEYLQPGPTDAEIRRGRAVGRASSWALWTVALGGWLVELSAVGFSKPAGDDGDPVSKAAANHRQNVLWAEHVSLMALVLVVGALLGACAAGSAPAPGRRARAAGVGALVATLVILAVGAYDYVRDFRIPAW